MFKCFLSSGIEIPSTARERSFKRLIEFELFPHMVIKLGNRFNEIL